MEETLRTVIHLQVEGRVYKFAWFSEDAAGFYWGHCGLGGDDGWPHSSYHADGTRHFRTGRNEDPPIDTFANLPIAKIDSVRCISTSAVEFSVSAMEGVGTEYETEDPRLGVSVFLDANAFEWWMFNLRVYLLPRRAEPEWIKGVHSGPGHEQRMVLASLCLPLRHFPDHKVGLVIVNLRGNERRPDN
jgi:hypothetical protein